MKHFTTIMAFVLMVSVLTYGQTTDHRKNFSDSEIQNLNNCIGSDNIGVKEWGIYLAGKHRVDESVDALLDAYKSVTSPSMKKRVLFSLCQINTKRSCVAISEITTHEEAVSLKKLCLAMMDQLENSYAAGL